MDNVVVKQLMGHANISMLLDNYTDVQNCYRNNELNKLDNYYSQSMDLKQKDSNDYDR